MQQQSSQSAQKLELALQTILTTSDVDKLKDQLQLVGQLYGNPQQFVAALDSLTLPQYTFGALYIIHQWIPRKGVASEQHVTDWLRCCAQVLCQGGKHLRRDPTKLLEVTHAFTELCSARQQPLAGVLPLRQCIATVQTTPATVTPQHADYLLLCLQARSYREATRILESPLLDMDPHVTGTRARDVQLMAYYACRAFAGQRRYKDAITHALLGLTAPAQAPSAIMLATYKLFLLISLLAHGEADAPPAGLGFSLNRSLAQMAKPYTELATKFPQPSCTLDQLADIARQYHHVFVADGMWGLVMQLLDDFQRRSVLRLTGTYVALPLAHIAESLNLSGKEAEAYLLTMISRGQLAARIDQSAGVVRFSDADDGDPLGTSDQHVVTRVQQIMSRLMELTSRLQNAQVQAEVTADLLSITPQEGEADDAFVPPKPYLEAA